MQGAREFAELFETGQHGRLYLVSGGHARGRTFHIYVLPEGQEAMPNGTNNPPLNNDVVEVYGIVSGNPGWTESYGWIYHGKWELDFALLVREAREKKSAAETLAKAENVASEEKRCKRDLELLSTYESTTWTPQEIEERLRNLPEAEWVRKMRVFHFKNGFYRPEDLHRLLGDQCRGIRFDGSRSPTEVMLDVVKGDELPPSGE